MGNAQGGGVEVGGSYSAANRNNGRPMSALARNISDSTAADESMSGSTSPARRSNNGRPMSALALARNISDSSAADSSASHPLASPYSVSSGSTNSARVHSTRPVSATVFSNGKTTSYGRRRPMSAVVGPTSPTEPSYGSPVLSRYGSGRPMSAVQLTTGGGSTYDSVYSSDYNSGFSSGYQSERRVQQGVTYSQDPLRPERLEVTHWSRAAEKGTVTTWSHGHGHGHGPEHGHVGAVYAALGHNNVRPHSGSHVGSHRTQPSICLPASHPPSRPNSPPASHARQRAWQHRRKSLTLEEEQEDRKAERRKETRKSAVGGEGDEGGRRESVRGGARDEGRGASEDGREREEERGREGERGRELRSAGASSSHSGSESSDSVSSLGIAQALERPGRPQTAPSARQAAADPGLGPGPGGSGRNLKSASHVRSGPGRELTGREQQIEQLWRERFGALLAASGASDPGPAARPGPPAASERSERGGGSDSDVSVQDKDEPEHSASHGGARARANLKQRARAGSDSASGALLRPGANRPIGGPPGPRKRPWTADANLKSPGKGPETASGPGSTQAGSRQRPSSSMPAMGSRGAQAGSQSNLKSPLASSSGPAGGPATARATRAGPTSPLPGGTASAPAKGHLSTGAGGSQSKLKSAGGAGSLASASASAGSSGPAGGSSSSSLKNLKKSAKGEGASRSSSTCAVQ